MAQVSARDPVASTAKITLPRGNAGLLPLVMWIMASFIVSSSGHNGHNLFWQL
jgi:hypothetical protein